MPSLQDHFRALEEIPPPERWPDLDDREPRAAPLSPPGRRLAVGALAFALTAAGLVLVVRAFRIEERPPAPASAVENGLIAFSRGGPEGGLHVMNPDGTGIRRVSPRAIDTDPAWSPDGSRIAFVRGFADEDAGIYVLEVDGTESRRITDAGSLVDGSDLGPAWSPDGSRIAFAREGRKRGAEVGNADMYVVNADGSDVVRLTDGPVMEYEPSWSPDGSRIAFEGYDLASGGLPPSPVRLYVMEADGTGIRELSPENVQGPAWSPDGSEIAYVDTETGSIMAIRPDGTGQRRILDVAELVGGVHLIYDVAWSPDGTTLAFMAGPDSNDTHIYVVNRDGSGVAQVTDDRAPDHSPAWQPLPVNATSTPELVQLGSVAFSAYTDGRWQVFSVRSGEDDPVQLTDLSGDLFHPAWSPDGSRIAVSVQRGARTHVGVLDADGSGFERLTSGPGWNYLPDWSPDGSRIVFVSSRDGNNEIYVMNADGSAQTRLTDHPDEDVAPMWSPDGARILFQSNRGGNNDIFVMNADGSDVVNLTETRDAGEFDPAWGPDGSVIAFASDRDGDPEIYVMAADGSTETRLTHDDAHDWNPAWSPDGSRIAFESDRDGRVTLYVMDPDGTNVSTLIEEFGETCCPAWQP